MTNQKGRGEGGAVVSYFTVINVIFPLAWKIQQNKENVNQTGYL
jgi:hypothetical protein